MAMTMHDSCDGCRYDLGGGRDNCTENVSQECRDGGGFEHWTARQWIRKDPYRATGQTFVCPYCIQTVYCIAPRKTGECVYVLCPMCGKEVRGTEKARKLK